MKPIPFPLALNIGVDVVHLPRILNLIQRKTANHTSSTNNTTYLERFTRRILCGQEQREFANRFKLPPVSLNPIPKPIITVDMARWLAGRFAAKEAARKAAPHGAGSLSWKDIIVRMEEDCGGCSQTVPGSSRRPEVLYVGKLGDKDGGRLAKLSIAHDGDYVVATVLAAA